MQSFTVNRFASIFSPLFKSNALPFTLHRLFSSSSDPYKTLGVTNDATAAQIKKAYFELAKKYHPDTCKDDAQAKHKFHQIQTAYEILSDPAKRSSYDRGEFSASPGGDGAAYGTNASGPFHYEWNSATGDEPFTGMFGDLFAEFTRMHQKGTPGRAGSMDVADLDISIDVSLTFEQAVKGSTTQVRYARNELCTTCQGDGIKPGTSKSTCSQCRGTGQFRRRLQGLFFSQTCPSCSGTGYQYASCTDCDGKGSKEKYNTVDVAMPAGLDVGDVVQRTGMGHSFRGYPQGSLYVRVVDVGRSRHFQRKGNDITSCVDVPLHLALMGGHVIVPTIWGNVEMKIDQGSIQPGCIKILRGKGIRNGISGTVGNHLATLQVTMPTKLNDSQMQKLEEFAKSLGAGAGSGAGAGETKEKEKDTGGGKGK